MSVDCLKMIRFLRASPLPQGASCLLPERVERGGLTQVRQFAGKFCWETTSYADFGVFFGTTFAMIRGP
ncbi:MAG: hypothetical protein KA788_07545, partial [Lacunisphaera sp.]|nr:hypothetical protein [Lacunisphaera sp.]